MEWYQNKNEKNYEDKMYIGKTTLIKTNTTEKGAKHVDNNNNEKTLKNIYI